MAACGFCSSIPNLNAEEGFNHGVADLSGGLKARGHVTGLININEALYDIPGDEEIVEQVRPWRPDFVAFSVMTQQYKYALRLGRAIKAAMPACPIGIGGVHAIMCTQESSTTGSGTSSASGSATRPFRV